MKPTIAITTSYDSLDIIAKHFHAEGTNYFYLREAYCDAILSAGGLPVLLPLHPDTQILKKIDGLVISGGSIYQLTRSDILASPAGMEEHKRALFELALLERAYRINLPVLGLCYGMQLINIFRGGTLKWLPRKPKLGAPRHVNKKHRVIIEKNTLLYNIIKKKEITVYSSHRQAIDNLGKGLVISAIVEDGVIEAIELPNKKFFLGTQWHPEVAPQAPRLFQRFVKDSSVYRKNKEGILHVQK